MVVYGGLLVVYREIYGNYIVDIVIYGEYPLVISNISMESHNVE